MLSKDFNDFLKLYNLNENKLLENFDFDEINIFKDILNSFDDEGIEESINSIDLQNPSSTSGYKSSSPQM